MGLIKVQNISPHSPQGEILEVTETKAKELVKLKQVRLVTNQIPETKIDSVKLKRIETKL